MGYYITETCSMKYPENELIYIIQNNTQWGFPKLWIQRNSACSQVSHWQAKPTKFKSTAGQKSCQWPYTSTATGIPFQVQHLNVEQWSTIASSTFWCWRIILFWRFHVKHMIWKYSKRLPYFSLKKLLKIISIFLKLT